MSNTVIRVDNLSKRYVLGVQQQGRHTTLRDKITDSAKSLSRTIMPPYGKSIPNSKRGEFWALKDVSFEIKQGDRVGFIGRNGAGKSTLLKILSRITEPTTGHISLKGRVASLLEVGTGFHQELTGRENIYLNGAILGMSKAEIKNKFDEIVEFSEVEKFLDTPVKRYSSGMYVRLAFAVAAHLEPEILIVDEVLAVGDAQFQKKCLGKMKDVGDEGRTVLFVSHNMAAIRSLCSRALFMKSGQLFLDADIETAIDEYLFEDNASGALVVWNQNNAPKSPEVRFTKAYILNAQDEYASTLDCRKEFYIVLEYELLKHVKGLRIGFSMQNMEGIYICGSNNPSTWSQSVIEPGSYVIKCAFPGYSLNAGAYLVNFAADLPPYSFQIITTPYCLSFTVEDVEGHGPLNEKLPGILRPKLNWDVEQLVD